MMALIYNVLPLRPGHCSVPSQAALISLRRTRSLPLPSLFPSKMMKILTVSALLLGSAVAVPSTGGRKSELVRIPATTVETP